MVEKFLVALLVLYARKNWLYCLNHLSQILILLHSLNMFCVKIGSKVCNRALESA